MKEQKRETDAVASVSSETKALSERLRDPDEPNALIVRRQAADEIERLHATIRTALDHWPGGTPYGALYYTLSDSIGYDPAHDENEREDSPC